MARVTVEDCLVKIPNKFELVLLASKRARDIERGASPSVPKDNDKPTIIALREIAEETISLTGLQKVTKKSLRDSEYYDDSVADLDEDSAVEIEKEAGMQEIMEEEDLENEEEDAEEFDDEEEE